MGRSIPPPSEPPVPGKPVRRSYSAHSGARDVDRAEQALQLKIAVYSLPGFILGLIAGLRAGHPLLGSLLGGLFVGGMVFLLVRGAGRFASGLHNPSGNTTPHTPEYSVAESLVARGRYREAVNAFEEVLAAEPTAAVPFLRIARIHRDHLGEMDESARWFRRALREADLGAGQALLARKELVELYVHRMGQPERAAPELARMAEELQGRPEGEWAARELAEVKEMMRQRQGYDASSRPAGPVDPPPPGEEGGA